MNFADAIRSVLTVNYANFTGRATRAEFWWWMLFAVVVGGCLDVIDLLLGAPLLSSIFSLAILIPSVAVSARRLHDLGRSGWWLMALLTVIGALLLLYWFVQPGEDDNRYGPTFIL